MLDAAAIAPETIRPLSRTEYDRMVEMGLFEGERVELIRGALVTMSPQGPLHAEVIERLHELLRRTLGGRARVRSQSPLALSDQSEPEPDILVFPDGDYAGGHPTTALLVIEVADSSLSKDRGVKAELYAEAGVSEYWVVNLVDRIVEVHRAVEAGRYTSSTARGTGDEIALVAFPDVEIAVADVL